MEDAPQKCKVEFLVLYLVESRFMSRKRVLLVIFIAFILVGFAARGPIVSTVFEWYLKGYCRTCLGSRLTYENLRQENDLWILDHPVLTTKKRLEEGGYRCQADRAVVKASISWAQRALSLTINVENPHLDVGKGAEDLRKLFEGTAKKFPIFEVHPQFHIPHGTIFVHDFTEDHLVPVPLFFQIDLACKEKREGCATLWMGEKRDLNDGFIATFSENEAKEPQINLQLENVNCSSLQQVLSGIWPEYKALEVVKGDLSGSVVITLSNNTSSSAEGKILLKDLNVLHAGIDCEIAISQLSLYLAPKEIERDGEKLIQTFGSFEILPSKMAIKKEGEPFWTIDNISGSAGFNTGDYVNFSLGGTVETKTKTRKLVVDGRGRLAQEGQASFSVDMLLKDEGFDNDTNFRFSARELSDQWSFGEVELLGFGTEELDLVQHLISLNYPQWQHVHIHQGNIDAAILVYLKGFCLSEVKVERIAAHRVAFSFNPWDLYASVESAVGSLSFDLCNEDPLKTLNADFKISQGKLSLEGLDKAQWQISGIDTNLTIHQGIFQKSLLKGTIAGLKGVIELDGTSAGPLILFDFHGNVQDFAQAFPDPIRKGLDKTFIGDGIRIIADAKRTADGLLFNGKVSVEAEGRGDEEIIFGFVIGRSSQGLWRRWPPHPLAVEYYSAVGFQALYAMTPAIATPIYTAYRHLIAHDIGFSGFTLKDGWFRAEKLPLNKYISPLLFRNDQMQLTGLGHFSGHFDEQKVVVNYDSKDMVLENSDFAIEIKSLGGENDLLNKKLEATYMFDFDKKTSFTSFPIRNATYFEKNSGLLFTEINAKLAMEDARAHFENLTTFCNGLYFSGAIDIDWSMPGEGVFEVDMRADEMYGKISELQHFLSHLNKSLVFLKIPLEGNAVLHKEGGYLHFFFDKEGYRLESQIQGAMTDGVIRGQNVDLSLQELSMNFDYHHQNDTLEFSDIQGTLLVGKPNHVEEYAVSGDKVRFTNYSRNEAEFDVWVGDKKRDIIRLAGKTRSEADENGLPYINFLFNRSLSHFGDVHPSTFHLALRDWSQVVLFQLAFDFQLKTLLSDLQRFSRTGLFFLSRGLLKEVNDIDNAKGIFRAELNYDSTRSTLHYRIDADDVAFGKREFGKFLLSGNKKGSLWSVDQMQLDEISLAFDVLKEGPLWNINFLGARLGNYLLLGMEGQYSDDDSHLEARINLFEADLGCLDECPLLGRSFNSNLIAGQVRASGSLHAEFDKAMPHGVRLNVQMNASLNHARIQDVPLEDMKNISFLYNSSSGFSIGNASLGIKSHENAIKAGVFLQEASYDIANNELLIDGLHFDVPVENLGWAVQSLREHFPGKITAPIADVIRSAKTQGSLQGALRLSLSESYSSLRINFNDGLYHFMGQDHDLSGFVIDYDPFSLKVFTEYRYQKHRLRLDAHSAVSGFDAGEIVLSDLSREGENASLTPLTIHWKIHPQEGYYIQKMYGDLSGMSFDFIRDPNKALSSDAMHLIGKLDVNLRKAASLMDEQIAARIANWELGEGYSLIGQCSIMKTKSKSLADSVAFQGELAGRDFELLGYRFYNLSAQLSYAPEAAYVRSLAIADTCGSMQVEQMDFFNQGNGFWQTVIPVIAINEFRPSLLHSVNSAPPRAAKSLVVRSLNIKDLNGVLGDKNSFKGSGQLTFANPPKKNLQHTLFAIPAELLTRIGLDLAVLTPVRGTIIFDIKEGKAILNRFKDVYSKGRLSKFYLPNNGCHSYIDFDGNLNLQVRMKQYNIIFKLAELFTVTVQGTLKKPTYTLQKQQKGEVANTR